MTATVSVLRGVQQVGSDRIQDLTIVEGRIGVQAADVSDAQSAGSEPIDCSGLFVAPGFVELQVNGGWGIDLQRDPTQVWELGERLVEVGVTSFCPTLTSDGNEHLQSALEASSAKPKTYLGAEFCGWHLEGPWLNSARRGAHSAGAIRSIDQGMANTTFTIDDLVSQGAIAIVTLAPELPGAIDAIARLSDAGITVSLGHSEATMSQARHAFDAGATMGTHVFNAMGGLHHRTLSLSTAVLLDAPAVGLIADGIHVAPEMLQIAWELAKGRIVLVSDAVAEMGLSSEKSIGDAARTADGTIAGSVVGIDQCVRNLVSYTSATASEALEAASRVPAATIARTDRGTLSTGSRADLILLSSELEVVMTVVSGEIVYDRR